MSRKSTAEYIAAKRKRYLCASKAKRSKILDEVQETTGFTRKYVINLLNGNIRYRARKGRGKTYGPEVAATLADIWREAGCPCAPYLQADIGMWMDEHEQYVANVNKATKDLILKMSASSMDRLLKGLPRVPPGDVQVDTFALGGGDPSENFFWILDGTDRKTQWTVLSPTWNRGQHATLEALKRIERKIPFPISSLHGDNGSEIINHHIAAFLGKNRPSIYLSRSRPRHCNDNAHVEEKNRSVGRQLFGERRIDCHDLLDDLIRICEEWSVISAFMPIAQARRFLVHEIPGTSPLNAL